jgi:small subunit ribosomal protein S17
MSDTATQAITRGRRKVRLGTVISDKMDKTVIVQVGSSRAHRLYRKTVQQRTRFKVHDEKNECGVGDLVRITETRPLSKEKRWRVLEIVEKAK